MVLHLLDIFTLADFRRVHKLAAAAADNIPQHKQSVKQAPNVLRGDLSIQSRFSVHYFPHPSTHSWWKLGQCGPRLLLQWLR